MIRLILLFLLLFPQVCFAAWKFNPYTGKLDYYETGAPTDATYITQTANGSLSAEQALGTLATGILKNTTTTGVLSIAVAGDFPTLNQNTTGSAATLTTPRTIGGTSFDGSANIKIGALNTTNVDATSSANLYGLISDETGSASGSPLAVFNQNPTINGATLTGVIDAGGATSTEIVNGTDPTTDAAGEIAIDSSAVPGSGIRFYGDAAYTLSGTYSKSFVILNPVAADDYPVWRSPWAITIKSVHLQCTGGTNIVGQLDEYDSNGANPAVVDSADITATAGNNANDDGSLSNPSIDANDYVGWHTTSISGTPTSVTVTFDFTIDQIN